MARWKILAGMHEQNDPDGKARVYKAGVPGADIFETDADMEKLNGKGGMMKKFERLPDENPVHQAARQGFNTAFTDSGRKAPGPELPPGVAPPTNKAEFHAILEKMSVQDLKNLAEAEEIDLKGATTKDAIIKAIKQAS